MTLAPSASMSAAKSRIGSNAMNTEQYQPSGEQGLSVTDTNSDTQIQLLRRILEELIKIRTQLEMR